MRPRIILNLAAFAVLGVILLVWAMNSIVTIDAIERPYTVTAEFDSSPGLRSDLEVCYLGVRVGSVRDVRLETGKVVVRMHLDHGTRVPNTVDAAVLRKSAVGEPYIEMDPHPNIAAGPPLKTGDIIPLARTHVAPEYKELFNRVGDLLKSVRPEDAKVLTHELALGLQGRDQTLRDLIGDAHLLTGTLADNAQVLDDLSIQLTRLSKTLAAGGPELAGGLNGLASFMGALKASRGQLDGVLSRRRSAGRPPRCSPPRRRLNSGTRSD
jgi:phospholipid/cholesterol/gamma-HCH transport system substrate-binding protein